MCIQVQLNETFCKCKKVNVYKDGDVSAYFKGDSVCDNIIEVFSCIIDGAHEMPAYGVSLNNETLTELSNVIWLDFIFDKLYESNGLTFEKLLISVQKNFYGFNIIRYNSDFGYDGRCFYYDLAGRNMDDLYNLLINL